MVRKFLALLAKSVCNELFIGEGRAEICSTVIKLGCSVLVAGIFDDRMFHKVPQSCYKQNDCVG